MEVCPIYQQARLHPEAVAVEWHRGTLTYRALDGLVRDVQQRLRRAGIKAFDRVGMVLPNSWQYVVLMQALFRLKAVAVPLSTRFTDEMVEQLLVLTGCKAVVGWQSRSPVKLLSLPELVNLENTSDNRPGGADKVPALDLNQPATILFSSGSTGMPKAILHTWGNHYFNALGSNENIAVAPADRWLLSLPLYHVAGQAILFRCLSAGATIVLAQKEKALHDVLREDAVTHVSLVSTQLLRLLEELEDNPVPSSLKGILLGGSAISQALIIRAHAKGLPIHTSYGMTEMASQVATTAPGAVLEELFTSGRHLKYRALRIDREGQILVRGKTLFAGLVTGPRVNDLVEAFDEAGWYATGDLGKLDVEGRLVVLGRKDNMFISGGENIHPEEIERALEQHASIQRAIVVPVPDEEFGCRPVAFLDVTGALLMSDVYDVHLDGRIARFMRPIAYFSIAEGEERENDAKNRPSGEAMKISRSALQERARQKMGC